MTVREFLQTTNAAYWHEAHWSLAATEEQAQAWFAQQGIRGKLYRVPYGWWCVPEKPRTELMGRIT